jgi:hypothetical protein
MSYLFPKEDALRAMILKLKKSEMSQILIAIGHAHNPTNLKGQLADQLISLFIELAKKGDQSLLNLLIPMLYCHSWKNKLASIYNYYDSEKLNQFTLLARPMPSSATIRFFNSNGPPVASKSNEKPLPFGMAPNETLLTALIPFPFHSSCIPLGEPLKSSQWYENTQPVIRISIKDIHNELISRQKNFSGIHFYIYRQFTIRSNPGFSRFLDLNGWDFIFECTNPKGSATKIEVRTMSDAPLDVTNLLFASGSEYLTIRISKFPKSILRMNESFIQLVAAIPSPEEWVSSLAKTTRLTKDHVLSSIRESFKSKTEKDDDDEIQTASVDFSLRCPLGYARMNWPGRSILCTHIQSFDLVYFLQVYLPKMDRKCPICNAKICLDDLMVDELFRHIVHNSSSDAECVRMNENAEWRVLASQIPSTSNYSEAFTCPMNLENYACKPQPEIIDLT